MATNIGCNIFEAISLQCKSNIGGIKAGWIGSFDSLESYTQDVDSIVTGMTIASGSTLYQMIPARASSNATEAQAVDNTNTLWTQSISLLFSKNQATLRNFITSIAKSVTIVILQDRNNNFWLYGSDNGCQSATDQATGTAEGDKNTWTIKFEAKESYPALLVSASVMAGYII